MYYPCSENKGADQLRSYCEADLRLCFRLCKLLVFSCTCSYVIIIILNFDGNMKQRIKSVVSKVFEHGVRTELPSAYCLDVEEPIDPGAPCRGFLWGIIF